MSSSPTTEMNLVGDRGEMGVQEKIGEGEKVNERTTKEEQNKKVIALVRTNSIYVTPIHSPLPLKRSKSSSPFSCYCWEGRLAVSGLVSIEGIMKSLSSYKLHCPLAVSLSRLASIHYLSQLYKRYETLMLCHYWETLLLLLLILFRGISWWRHRITLF